MKIYTKTGDDGTTSLPDGSRTAKNDALITAYGDTDELNAQLGRLAAMMDEGSDKDSIIDIQRALFRVCGGLPGNREGAAAVCDCDVEGLERLIDRCAETAPLPQSFIVPGGSEVATQCHVCRTVCRRAERSIISLNRQYVLSPAVTKYVNRLSDYLFVLAIKLNHIKGTKENNITISCK